MKKTGIIVLVLALLMVAGSVFAADVTMIGAITKIELAADGKSATAILKDTDSGAEVVIFIDDELTLDKFKDKRIVTDDEIRCRYENEGGKNHSKSFKKTAGC